MRARTIGLLLTAAAVFAVSQPAGANGVIAITISNFKYCQANQCGPADGAYLRTPEGPVADNPAGAVVTVHPGDKIVWTYADSFCDAFNGPIVCPGHEVRFESDGSVAGTAAARSGATTITWDVPANATPGSVLRYYCDINYHWIYFMTGALKVA